MRIGEKPVPLQLAAFSLLSGEDRQLIEEVAKKNVKRLRPRQDLIREGEKPRAVNLVLEGWAQRYKQLADGRRQILSFFIPGDFCDANVYILKEMDHSVASVSEVTYAEISPEDFENLMAQSPAIGKALWWSELVVTSIQREWTTNIGQRTAYERIAHLLCEMFIRMSVVGLVQGDQCEFPVTQTEIADATGLTPVHVNRILQELRKNGVIELKDKRLLVPDLARLKSTALFNSNYLHLDG